MVVVNGVFLCYHFRKRCSEGWFDSPENLEKIAHGKMELLSHKNASSPDPLHQEVIFKRPLAYQRVSCYTMDVSCRDRKKGNGGGITL